MYSERARHTGNFNPRSLTGVTRFRYSHSKGMMYFNPRSLTGVTVSNDKSKLNTLFQSTLPHGSDMKLMLEVALVILNFNPRSLTGVTKEPLDIWHLSQFQSTLPHGSDL